MIKGFRTMMFALVVVMTITATAQNDPKAKGLEAITDDMVKAQLTFLASDWMEGREGVSKGSFLAADYIASIFQMSGLAPAGDRLPNGTRSYLQRIPMIRVTQGGDQYMNVITNTGSAQVSKQYIQGVDYMAVNSGDVSRNLSAPVTFIGYGMVDEANGYDDLKGIDVKGKIVVRLSGFPGHRDTLSAAYEKFNTQAITGRTTRGSDPRLVTANNLLVERGVLAIITIIPDRLAISSQFAVNTNFYPNQRLSPTNTGRLSIYPATPDNSPLSLMVSPRMGMEILGQAFDVEGFEKNVSKTMKPQSSLLPGKSLEIVTSVKNEIVMGVNICAMIEGKNKDQNVVVGAHYDHVGTNGAQIWNGADDNASGTVAVMAIAKAFVASGVQPECNIIFAAWAAEENGLLGSRYFVETFPDIEQVRMNINFDMIARDDPADVNQNTVEYTYADGFPQWFESSKANLTKYNIPLVLKEIPRPIGFTTGTDYASFSTAGRPFVGWFTGFHPDYHQYTDKLNKVNWTKCIHIIRLAYLNAWDIVNQ
ncbi:MAG: M20/M25/M40 family metallo-hydrolase [Tannerella sp.]|jgi:hypothetical protein|nr:M20/M25/M40 family metallo-hydrolase [Tannerella sp.]